MTTPVNHTSHLETPSGAAYGKSLRGFGLNLLVSDVLSMTRFLVEVLEGEQVYSNADFAIIRLKGAEIMLHADHTYGDHPLLALTGDGAIRGIGAELRLYDMDPDATAARAMAGGHAILQPPTDKPHGLRECYIAGPDSYIWVPGRKLP